MLRNASATSETQHPPFSDLVALAAPFQTPRFAGFPMALLPFLLPGLPRNTVTTSVAPTHQISHAEVPKASQPGILKLLASVQGEPCGRLLSQDSDALRIRQALEKDGEAVSPSVFYKSWPPSLHLPFLFSSDTFNTHSSSHTPYKTSSAHTFTSISLILYHRHSSTPSRYLVFTDHHP